MRMLGFHRTGRVAPAAGAPGCSRAGHVHIWLACLPWAVALAAGCAGDERSEIQVEVRQVMFDPTSRAPVVVLQDVGQTRALPIWIGASEAQAIAMHMEGIQAPRPLTHDLVKDVLDRTGVEFRKVLIYDLRDSTYYARIFLRSQGGDVEIDSRPSDAIALAMRFGKPIFVVTALFERQGALDLRTIEAKQTLTLGGVMVQGLSGELAEHFDLAAGEGVLVSALLEDTHGSLRPGDVILAVDGQPVRGLREFERLIRDLSRTADLSVQREGRRIHVAFEPPEK